jgi:ribosome-binding factor A
MRQNNQGPNRRLDRVAGDIADILSTLIREGLRDPRITPITITVVRMSVDLRIAHVNFMPLGGKGDHEGILKGLYSATGFLRRELGQRLQMRHVPELRFHLDDSISRGVEMTQFLDALPQTHPRAIEGEEGAGATDVAAPAAPTEG